MSSFRSARCVLFVLLAIGALIGAVDAKSPSRISGGRLADDHEFRAVVTLSRPGKFVHTCGGAVIAPRFVLTAAHCVDKISSNNIVIHAGIEDVKDTRNVIERSVAKIFLHPEYTAQTATKSVQNDIAILILEEDLPISGSVKRLLLPREKPEEGNGYSFAGWGITDPHPKDYQYNLKTLNMSLGRAYRCNGFISQTICGFSDNGALCGGDSGSPLMRNGYVYGIASMSNCVIGEAANFANVFNYHNWIVATTRQYRKS